MHADQTLTAQQTEAAAILDQPNKWRVLTFYMRNPQALAEYVRLNCTTSSVLRSDAFLDFKPHLPASVDLDAIPDGNMTMCMSNNGDFASFRKCAAPTPCRGVGRARWQGALAG
jgi:hypothetical protein